MSGTFVVVALVSVPALLSIGAWVLWIREPSARGARSWILLAGVCAATLSLAMPFILPLLHGPFSSYSMLPVYFILASPAFAVLGLLASLIGKGQGRILAATASALVLGFWCFVAYMLKHVSFH